MEEAQQKPPIVLSRQDLDQNPDPELLNQLNLDAGALFTQYPPVFRTRAKLASYRKMKEQGDYHPSQVLRVTRWKCMEPPETYKLASTMKFDYSDTVFQYAPRTDADAYKEIDWHMNFAHSNLFCAYASTLLAQDELQVLECPILASVREFLTRDAANKVPGANNFAPLTIGSHKATPVLIGNADRVISLDTYPDAEKKRPHGLYGNNFERATAEAIDLATNLLKPSNRVNIFALEAPSGGYGNYTEGMIEFILESCYSGFLACKKESQKISALVREEQKVEGAVEAKDVHTNIYSGFWGCGAYGGDREIMVILQIVAAQLAGVDSLTLHTVHKEGKGAVEKALERFKRILQDVQGDEIKVEELVGRLAKDEFKWGFSNGT